MTRKTLLNKAIKTYRDEGLAALLRKSLRYTTPRIIRPPTVVNPETPTPFFILKPVYNLGFRNKHGAGTNVMEEDWDSLILLDACRFDDFKLVNTLTGELQSRISRGVDSPEFIRKNFIGGEFHDTVYVTANPHVHKLNGTEFHKTITEPLSAWDDERQCVPPKSVTRTAIEAHEQYPNKRIIVHYMQPHDPPLGPVATELRAKHQIVGPQHDGGGDESQRKRIMELVADGTISIKKAHEAYRETLRIVLESVKPLLEKISGKIIISADHGELFGEQPYPLLGKLYEHYRNPRTIELCKVPWFVVDSESPRRKIIEEKGIGESTTGSREDVQEQLEALGYK